MFIAESNWEIIGGDKPMEINLSYMIWPVCLLRCNETLSRLQPGETLSVIVSDPDMVNNILLLIKSQPDLQYNKSRESGSYRITVNRMRVNPHGVAEPVRRNICERS